MAEFEVDDVLEKCHPYDTDLGTANDFLKEAVAGMHQIVGVVFGIFAVLFGVAGLLLLKKSHLLKENSKKQSGICKSPTFLWWTAFVFLYVIETICSFAASAFAPATLLIPLGALSTFLKTAGSVMFLGETLTRKDIYAAILLSATSCCALFYGSTVKQTMDLDCIQALSQRQEFLVFEAVCIVAIIVIGHQVYKRSFKAEVQKGHNKSDVVDRHTVFPASFALLLVLISVQTAIIEKFAVEISFISLSGVENQIDNPTGLKIIAGFILMNYFQIQMFDYGVKTFDVMTFLPMAKVFGKIIGPVTAFIAYNEWDSLSWNSFGIYGFGCFLALLGLSQIMQRKSSPKVDFNCCQSRNDYAPLKQEWDSPHYHNEALPIFEPNYYQTKLNYRQSCQQKVIVYYES